MKTAIIGCAGHWGYALLPAGETDARIVAIAPGPEGGDMDRVAAAARTYGHQPVMHADWRALLDAEKPDVVTVDCAFCHHATVAAEALRRGCHVFCEKPVATTHDDLALLRAAHRDGGGHFAAMLELRYAPDMFALWQAVRGGAVGEVRLLSAQKSYRLGTRAPLFRSRALSGGTIPWIGSHAVDWIAWLADVPFREVSAWHTTRANCGHDEMEMSAACAFRMERDVFATVTVDYLRPAAAPTHGDDRVRVAGTAGVAEARGGRAFLIDAGGERELALEPRRSMFAEFLRQIRGEGACLVDAEASFENTRIALLTRDAADSGRPVLL